MDGGKDEAPHPLQQSRIAPEDVERFIEQHPVLGSADEDCMQSPVEVLTTGNANRLDRPQRVEHRAASQGEARRAQGAGKVHEVDAEAACGARRGAVQVFGRDLGAGQLALRGLGAGGR